MLHTAEKQQLRTLLAKAPPGEVSFNFHELQGFLFGLAITPDYILPSDWLPVVFTGDRRYLQQIEELTSLLTRILHRLIAAFHDDELAFPYAGKGVTPPKAETICRWSCGLEEALSLREELWNPACFPRLPKTNRETLYSAILTIQGLTAPEETSVFFGMPSFDPSVEHTTRQEPLLTPAEIKTMLIDALPQAIDTVQQHARLIEKHKQTQRTKKVRLPKSTRSLARQERTGVSGRLVFVDFRKRRRTR